jgi:hypothetical protein
MFFVASAAHAQMYKCVDDRGKTQYSDKPCPEGKGKEVDIRGQPPISGKVTPRKDDIGQQERDFQNRQISKRKWEEYNAKQEAQKKARCDAMATQLKRLTEGMTFSKTNEKGERVYMDEAQRGERIAQLRTEMQKQGCAG